jgi:hypothetical protein
MGDLKNLIADRSCATCVKTSMCFVFRDLNRLVAEMPAPPDGAKTPGTKPDVFVAAANCCVWFQRRVVTKPGTQSG